MLRRMKYARVNYEGLRVNSRAKYSCMYCKYKEFEVTSAQFTITFHIKRNDNEAMAKICKSKINAAHYRKCC